MAKQWSYTDSDSQHVSDMICTAGRHPIVGQYRFRETDAGYFPQCRECSKDDPAWARKDQAEEQLRLFDQRRRAAYAEFVREFGVPFDLIDDQP